MKPNAVNMAMVVRILLLLGIAWMCMSASADAAVYTVNTASDSHDVFPGDSICGDPGNPSSCSIRASIEEANALTGPDTILIPFSLSPYRLQLGELLIAGDSLLLRGQGGRPVIDGANNPYLANTIRIIASFVAIEGLQLQRARFHGILIESSDNTIGGMTSASRNLIIGSGIDDSSAAGITIAGEKASGNHVTGNYIGLLGNGTTTYPNPTGILLAAGAHDNLIGGSTDNQRNVVSGNSHYGLVIRDGAHNNVISGNFVGPDATGAQGPGNRQGGILIADGAQNNQIGGHARGERNIISSNLGDGVTLVGSQTVANLLAGNFIGLDISGILPIGNHASGVLVTNGAHHNLIGDTLVGGSNFITGNLGDGLRISGVGCDSTFIRGNFIGFDTSGFRGYGNGWDFGYGIYLGEGAGEAVIGGSSLAATNYIGGNFWGGIFLSGSDHNHIMGNYIGVSLQSLNSAPNGAGIVLRNGSSNNLIGGSEIGQTNVISGNRADIFPFGAGVVLYDAGTSENFIIGNFIGTDNLSSRALRNGSAGVIIGNGATYNVIGGPTAADRNIIAGNGAGSTLVTLGAGVHIYGEGTAHNRVIGNYIGCGSDSALAITNLGNGVGIYAGAQYNVVGGDSAADGNLITFNALNGVYIDGASTKFNKVRYNRFRQNGNLAIALSGGAQDSITPPIITSVASGLVSGYSARPGSIVDIYLADSDPTGYGEGSVLIATGTAAIDGTFSVPVASIDSLVPVSAMITDQSDNSSEFSENVGSSIVTGIEEGRDQLPGTFALEQNIPNPFNPATRIRFSLPRECQVRLEIYNLLGECVARLVQEEMPAGSHEVVWQGNDQTGRPVASGIYLYRLVAGANTDQKKMLLLK